MQMSNRETLYGDIGSLIRIEGIVIGGGGGRAALLLPGADPRAGQALMLYHTLNIEEWSDWLQRSDNPEILVGPSLTGPQGATLPKIWARKLRYEISGAVQQKVWASDGFQCVYCGAQMGKVLMTIDHFQPLELGGVNDTTNYVTACKPCNKSKGSQAPDAWLATKANPAHSFEALKVYLENRKL